MPEQPATERTEQPTPRKLRKAQEKGQVPHSQELTSTAILLSLLIVLILAGSGLCNWLINEMKLGMSCQTKYFTNIETFISFINGKIIDTFTMLWPIMAAVAVGGIVGTVASSGLNFSTQTLEFKFSQLNPVEGFSKLFNARSGVRLLVSVLKLICIFIIVWLYIKSQLASLASLRWADTSDIFSVSGKIILGLLIRICVALLAISLAEALYQKWKYIQDLKMTRQEVKQDIKETEGLPELKRRIRKLQFEIAYRRTLREVPKATVVLVNPTHYAVALRYETKTMDAPVLLAKGADHLAEKIREIARAYGVPIISRPELARTIYSTVKPGQTIPESLYIAVAQVLSLVYRLRRKAVHS
jgi:flagellar biosynthetic protein FlhB